MNTYNGNESEFHCVIKKIAFPITKFCLCVSPQYRRPKNRRMTEYLHTSMKFVYSSVSYLLIPTLLNVTLSNIESGRRVLQSNLHYLWAKRP